MGVWNLDDILDSGYVGLHIEELETDFEEDFSSAVLVVKAGERSLCQLLSRYVELPRVRKIQNDVKAGRIPANY